MRLAAIEPFGQASSGIIQHDDFVTAEEFAIAKRVYIAIDEDAGRARTRMDAALEGIYGHRVPAIEAAAITGTATDCVREVNQVAAAGAELILFTALFDQREQMEQLAAAVLPKLG